MDHSCHIQVSSIFLPSLFLSPSLPPQDPAKRPAAKRLQKHHVFILEAPRVVPEELLIRIKEVQRRFAERAAAAAARAQAKQPSGPGGLGGGPAAPGGTVVARAPAASVVSTVKVNDGPGGASGTFVDHSAASGEHPKGGRKRTEEKLSVLPDY